MVGVDHGGIVITRERKRETQIVRRKIRAQLGLCADCIEPPLPGYTRCAYHRDQVNARGHRYDAKIKAKRGWKLVRVPV